MLNLENEFIRAESVRTQLVRWEEREEISIDAITRTAIIPALQRAPGHAETNEICDARSPNALFQIKWFLMKL
jgi:hypothetical protein